MDVIPPPLSELFQSRILHPMLGLSDLLTEIPDLFIHLPSNSSSVTLTSDTSVHNLGITFFKHLFFSRHISHLSRSCFLHIRDLRCVWHMAPLWNSLHRCCLHCPVKARLLQYPFSQPLKCVYSISKTHYSLEFHRNWQWSCTYHPFSSHPTAKNPKADPLVHIVLLL